MSTLLNKLATSVATTRPTDDIAAVDARKPTTSQPLIKPSTTPADGGVLDKVTTAVRKKSKLTDIGQVLTVSEGRFGIDPKTAGSKIDNIVGLSVSGIYGESNEQIKANAVSNLFKLTGSQEITQIGDAVTGLFTIDRTTDTSSVKGLLNAVSKYAGIPGIGNITDAIPGMATGLALLDTAVGLGVPDLIDTIIGKIGNDKLAKQKLIDMTRNIIVRGDLRTLQKVMDWIGPEGVLLKVPNAPQLILAAYRFPPDMQPEQYPDQRALLFNILDRFGPNWYRTKRGSEYVYDLEVFTRCSDASKTLLNLTMQDTPLESPANTFVVPTWIAGLFKPVNIDEHAKKQYPFLALWV